MKSSGILIQISHGSCLHDFVRAGCIIPYVVNPRLLQQNSDNLVAVVFLEKYVADNTIHKLNGTDISLHGETPTCF